MKRRREQEEIKEEEYEDDEEEEIEAEEIEAIEPEKSIYPDGGGWRRGKLLGSGAHGQVYLAHFPKPSKLSLRFKGFPQKVAVKSAYTPSDSNELKTEKAVYESLAEKQSKFLLRYLGDDITVAKDGRHLLNLFLEYASGGSLFNVILKSGEFGLLESQAKGFTRAILLGISHIHEEGYIHRDLKPENVLLVKHKDGYLAKIGDFGLVKSVEDETDLVVGTKIYLAPESVNEGVQEQASDIWALGCIVYAMLNGTMDWVGEMIIDDSGELYSREAADFINDCLTRIDLDRPSAEMLLSHPFIMTLRVEEEDGERFRQSEDNDASDEAHESENGSEKSKNETVILDGPPTVFRGGEDGYDGDQGSKSSEDMP